MNEMNTIDKQLKLTWDYYAMWFVMLAGVLAFFKPWELDLPWFSKVAFVLVIPFLLMMAIYIPIQFMIAVIKSGKRGLIIFMRFISFLIVAGVIFGTLLLSGNYTPENAQFIGVILTTVGVFLVNYKINETSR